MQPLEMPVRDRGRCASVSAAASPSCPWGCRLTRPVETLVSGGVDGTLSFQDDLVSPGLEVERNASLRSGTLRFPELGSSQDVAQSGVLSLGVAAPNAFKIDLLPDPVFKKLRFQFMTAGTLTSGTLDGRSLMPTWIEFLSANNKLALFVGAVVWLYSFFVGMRSQWW